MRSPAYFPPLLQTRLHAPILPGDVTPRARLDTLIEQGVTRRLLLITAPAGYGKTTAVLLWAQRRSLPVAWLALDAGQDDLALFVACFVAAIQAVAPATCRATEQLVSGGQAPASVLLAALVNDLAQQTQRLALVIDDYHVISAKAVHEFMATLIDALPPALHLILMTRTSPPLPLARWRGRGDLAEIRAAELRSDESETPALLSAMMGAPLPTTVVDAIHSRTEGWVTGLRLVALSLQRRDPAQLLATFEQAGSANIRDYLLDEVLSRQPAAVQRFLLDTSILERFSAPLCAALVTGEAVTGEAVTGEAVTGEAVTGEAVTGEAERASRTMLDFVTAAGLFVTMLDEMGEWRRYHPLFAELLRLRLQHLHGVARVATLHSAAGRWFASQGLIDEAIRHLLVGGALNAAADVVAGQFQAVLNREDWPQLERWLALLPEPAVMNHPVLLLARAWCLQFHLALAGVPPLLARLDARLPLLDAATATVLAGRAAPLRAFIMMLHSDPAAGLEQTEIGLMQTPDEDRYIRSMVVYFRALLLHMVGRGEEAEAWLLDLLGTARGSVDAFTVRLQFALCSNYRIGGELAKLRATAGRMVADAQAARLPLGEGWAHVFLGHVAYETNELAEAETHYSAGVRMMYVVHAAAVRECLFGLTLVQVAQRRFEDAGATLARLREFRGGLDPEIDSLAARLALAQGDQAAALRWASSFRPGARPPFLQWQEIPALTAARILTVSAQDAELRRALELVEPIAAWAERSHCTWRSAECAVLRAVALAGLGRTQAADDALHTALLTSAPADYRRTFLDIGGRLHDLLTRQLQRRSTAGAARLLLRALADERVQPAPLPLLTEGYADALTTREMEVLTLLARRYSNKEIAADLFITTNTVKRHTLQIFAKLGVNDRRTAVERAQQRGLLNGAG